MSGQVELIAGRYRLGERIGSGAMGVVWQATDERLQRTVALKHVHTPHGLTPEERQSSNARVLREGRIAARVHHPCAITVHDVVEHDGDPWLVQEYLPSRSLAAWLAEHGPLAPEHAATAGAGVAAALAVAHSAGVVHRDVKPANVLLGDDGSVKITDFGISRASGDVTLTSTGLIAGTPAYLAPEMARGETPATPCDVFSLGSTLYAAVEGRPPFADVENPLALLHVVAAGDFPPPRHAGALTALLMRLMRVDPDERPSMTQVAAALHEIRHGRQVPAESLAPPAGAASRETATQHAPAGRPDAAQDGTRQAGAAGAGTAPSTGTGNGPALQRYGSRPVTPARGAAAGQVAAAEQTRRQPVPAPNGNPARPGLRQIALAALAVLVAIAVGIGVSSLLMSLAG